MRSQQGASAKETRSGSEHYRSAQPSSTPPHVCTQEKEARWEEDAYYQRAWEEVLNKQEKERTERYVPFGGRRAFPREDKFWDERQCQLYKIRTGRHVMAQTTALCRY